MAANFDEWFSSAYVNQRLSGALACHMRAAWDAAVAQSASANKQSTKKGACDCGSTKYSADHLPQDHAGWRPD
jgi:hypothetical protein